MLPAHFSQKKLLILGSIVMVFLAVLFVIFSKQKAAPGTEFTVDQGVVKEEQPSVNPAASLPVSEVPSMTFAAYEAAAADTLAVPATVKSYTFNSGFSLPFVSIIGQKLGLKENKQEANTVLLYNSPESNNPAYLQFNLDNGKYEYNSYGSLALPEGPAVNTRVRNYLLGLGLIDETVGCDITYQRTSISDATFVECHRDWNKAGLPIYNFIGLLNIPELSSLEQVKVGMVDEYTMDDTDIVNVSTGQDGKARPNDYNTVTAVVDGNGNLLRLTSNLRMIEASVDFAQNDLYTPSEALNLFKSGSSTLSLVVPADQKAAWDTVFPENTAYNLKANVTDFVLTYIENPFGGKSLTPMYLARGTAETAEGYQVKFLQAVPAGRNQQTLSGEVAVLMAAAVTPPDDEGLKRGTFNPEQRRIEIQTPPPQAGPCVPAESQLSPILNLGEFGMLGLWSIGTIDSSGQRYQRSGQWYLVPLAGQPLPDIYAVVAAFDATGFLGRGDKGVREMDNLQKEWAKYNFCPLRVSGSSPTLFLYGTEGQSYDVSVSRLLTYAYPLQNGGHWNVVVGQDELNVNNKQVDSIYYEYKPLKFDKPATGWRVSKKGLAAFANKVGQQLGLTANETERLAFELNLAAYKVESEELFVGPIPQTEVDEKVALEVSPQVPVVRYHFYVDQAAAKGSVPSLTPITRSSSMVVEVGAFSPESL